MTVYTASIAASADDAHEFDDGTGFNAGAASVRVDDSTTASARYNGGLRFPSTGIPQGSTINVGTFVTWVRVASGSDSPDATLYCENVDAAANYTDTADVTSRAVTTASVSYSGTNLGAGAKNTPDLAAPVQEVVSRAGFGGTVNFIFKGNNNTAGEGWRMLSFDNAASIPSVTIDYTEPVGGGVLVQRTVVGVGL